MDPNATLDSLRSLLVNWEEWGDLNSNAEAVLDEILDLFFALDNWLTSGGFRPDDWN